MQRKVSFFFFLIVAVTQFKINIVNIDLSLNLRIMALNHLSCSWSSDS